MKRTLHIFLLCVTFTPGVAFAAPAVTNVSGALTHGSAVTVSGSGFGTRADYNDINDTWHGHRYMNFRWTDFSFSSFPGLSSYNGNPTQSDGFYPQYSGVWWDNWNSEGLTLVSGGPSESGKYLKRRYVPGSASGELGSASVDMPDIADNYNTLFISSKFAMISSGTTQQSGKAWRVWGDGNAGSIYMTSGGGYSMELRGDGSTEDCPSGFNGDGIMWGGSHTFVLETWDRVDFWLDKPGGYVTSYVNGDEQWSAKWWCGFGLGGHTIDFPDMIDDASRGGGTEGSYNFTDIYVDFTQARVEVCDAVSYSASDHCEVQIPTVWSNNSISVAMNFGGFSSGAAAYLYVIDPTGVVNTSGFPVTLGGAPDTIPPATPTSLGVQ